jgi:hemolysin D
MSLGQKYGAFRDLFGRYGRVFRYFWTRRKEHEGNLFNEHEAAFLPAALSLQEMPVSSSARLTAKVLMALVAVALTWAIFGRIDIIVNAKGKVVPSGRVKAIASLEIASVRALHVQEGQHVNAGDVLVELDTSSSDAERDKATEDRMGAILESERAKALISAIDRNAAPQLPKLETLRTKFHADIPSDKWQESQQHLDGVYRDYKARLQRIDSDIARYGAALPLATQRATDYRALLANNDVPRHAWLEKEQERIDLEGQLADARNQRFALIADVRKTALDSQEEGERIAAASNQDAIKSAARSKLLQLTAPVEGTVQQLTVHTVGGVVPAAQTLMLIVPSENGVELEASLENKDVGFVQEGQSAAVKIEAFEYTKYGTVPAVVRHVSHDAVEDEKKGLLYSVNLIPNNSTIFVEGKAVPLTPGLAVNIDIKTGERRIIEYILSPLMEHQREALHER